MVIQDWGAGAAQLLKVINSYQDLLILVGTMIYNHFLTLEIGFFQSEMMKTIEVFIG